MDFFQLLSEFARWWKDNKRNPVQAGLAAQLDRIATAVPPPATCQWNDQRVAQVIGVMHRLQHFKLRVEGRNQPKLRAALTSWYQLKHRLLELPVQSKPPNVVLRLTRSDRADAASVSIRYRSEAELFMHWPYYSMSAEAHRHIEARRQR